MTKRKIFAGILLLASSIALMFYAYLGSFTRLIADDFCSVYFARRLHMLRYIWYWYLTWGGRYSAIAVDSFIAFIKPHDMPFMPFIVLFVWFLITSFTLHQFLMKEIASGLSSIYSMMLASITLTTILSVTPMFQQVLYWWNGMRTYIPALISFTLHIGLLYWAFERLDTRRKIILGCLFSFLLAFFSAGFNETFTLIQFIFFAELAVLRLLTRKLRFNDPLFILLSVAGIASALALLIMLTSPGTSNRQEYFTAAPDLITMLTITINGYGEYLVSVLTSLEKVSALIGMVSVSIWMGLKGSRESSLGWMLPLVLISGVLLSFASLVPSAYALSEMPAPRTFVIPTFILVISLMYGGFLTGRWLTINTQILKKANIQSGLLVISLLFVLCSTWFTTNTLYKDRNVYIEFAQRWDTINAQILEASAEGYESVTIPGIYIPAVSGRGAPTDNPRYWVNQCYSQYYGIQVLAPDPNTQ